MKYLFCYYIEKLHRHCFDVIYIQDYKSTFKDKFLCWILTICQYFIPDYRPYLRKWHENRKSSYIRYTPYFN